MLASRRRYYKYPTELLSNPGFPFTATTGWTPSANASLSVVSDALRITAVANGSAFFYAPITCEIGKHYIAIAHIKQRSLTGNTFLNISTTNANTSDVAQRLNGTLIGEREIYFKANQTTLYVSFGISSLSLANETLDINSFSVKEYV